MLMHTHSVSRPWRLAPSTPWETDHLARATRCVDLAVAAPAGTPGEPADTRSGRSQQCPQHLLHRQRLILLYGGATIEVPRNRSCGGERCFPPPCPVDSPYAEAAPVDRPCRRRRLHASHWPGVSPHVVQPPELHSWAPSSMTRGPEDGHLGPSWVKQTPMSVEKYSVPQLPRQSLTWAQTICQHTLRLHVTCDRSV
jgi:hypothetical protein